MLIRLSLIVAIIGGLAVAGINFFMLKEKITETLAQRDKNATDRDNEKRQKESAQKELASTKTTLEKTTKELASTKSERDTAVALADEKVKAAGILETKLKATETDLSKARDTVAAWESLQIPLPRAKEILTSLNKVTAERVAIEAEKDIIYSKYQKVTSQLISLLHPDTEVVMPTAADLKGKVLAVDPKFDFVVLDIGEKQGVLPNAKLFVSHNGTLVAQLKITDHIEANRCIANVLPGFKYSEITEGDQVIASVVQ